MADSLVDLQEDLRRFAAERTWKQKRLTTPAEKEAGWRVDKIETEPQADGA